MVQHNRNTADPQIMKKRRHFHYLPPSVTEEENAMPFFQMLALFDFGVSMRINCYLQGRACRNIQFDRKHSRFNAKCGVWENFSRGNKLFCKVFFISFLQTAVVFEPFCDILTAETKSIGVK